jgi:hypothetical protein
MILTADVTSTPAAVQMRSFKDAHASTKAGPLNAERLVRAR